MNTATTTTTTTKIKESTNVKNDTGTSNVPSGFILKLYQMVNGAPNEVITVRLFSRPKRSFFFRKSFVDFQIYSCSIEVDYVYALSSPLITFRVYILILARNRIAIVIIICSFVESNRIGGFLRKFCFRFQPIDLKRSPWKVWTRWKFIALCGPLSSMVRQTIDRILLAENRIESNRIVLLWSTGIATFATIIALSCMKISYYQCSMQHDFS